ncbi:MAG: LptF/LptG family permease [Puniceicoccales bacterium]|jgi:LPS export ABC transporter permease LptG|nr:LptF/LptG family permease [Puniceicoccales bacterium]
MAEWRPLPIAVSFGHLAAYCRRPLSHFTNSIFQWKLWAVILQLHIWRSWFRTVLCTFFLIFSILLLERIQHELPELIRCSVGATKISAYFFFLLPSLLPLSVPVSIFIGTLLAFGKLQRNGEIIAMRSSGLSVVAMTWAVWLSGVGAAALMHLLASTLIPYGDSKVQSLAMEMKARNSSLSRGDTHMRNVTFDCRDSGRVWFIGDLDLLAGVARSVDICAYDGDGNVIGKIHGDSAVYVDGAWKLSGIREWTANGPLAHAATAAPVGAYFTHLDESPELIAICQRRVRAISTKKLRMILDHIPADDKSRAAYATAYHMAHAGCWSCLASLFCAIPFAIGGTRINSVGAIAKAIGLLLMFHFVSCLCQMLGADGAMNSIVAAWLPNGLVAALGFILLLGVR